MKDFESIKVGTEDENFKLFANPKGYDLIGVGYQGAVFQLTPERCVKMYYRSNSDRKAEEKVLKIAQGSPFFPKVFEVGKNYIVMEYIRGVELEQFLIKEKKISGWLTSQLIEMFKEMKRLKLTRLDADLRHIIVKKEEKSIKVIDHVNSLKKYYAYPKHLFKGLSKLGFLDEFIKQVKEKDNTLYKEWKKAGIVKGTS